MPIKSKIIDRVKQELSLSNQGAHTLDHTLRVYSISLELSKELEINMRVVEAAALLHDIGRTKEHETGVSHSILSGKIGRDILSELDYTESEIDQVVDSIRTHRFSEGIEPTSLEGQILSDADKLDALGAIGIYRAIAQAVSTGKGIEGFLMHADEKLLRLKDLMHTERAREIAITRHNFLQSFVTRLRDEVRDQS